MQENQSSSESFSLIKDSMSLYCFICSSCIASIRDIRLFMFSIRRFRTYSPSNSSPNSYTLLTTSLYFDRIFPLYGSPWLS